MKLCIHVRPRDDKQGWAVDVLTKEKPWGLRPPKGCQDVRAWVLDTLRAEGWDVVEEGEGDGDR